MLLLIDVITYVVCYIVIRSFRHVFIRCKLRMIESVYQKFIALISIVITVMRISSCIKTQIEYYEKNS